MCGIAGGIALTREARVDRERLNRMAGLLAHRGPDAQGFWSDPTGRAALAHRRLSVIDLTGGAQPMIDASGKIAMVFNGEIYDYREQRAALQRAGVTFRTQSDTEVLLRLYERYGADCVDHLRGMFAFAVWDGVNERLVLARDRMGKKPLFYQVEKGCLYFASTLRALRDTSTAPRRINLQALDAFLRLGYIPAPLSIEDGIAKLPAGTVLEASVASISERRFWAPGDGTNIATPQHDFSAAVDQADELLTTAVALRLRSDVPLGVFLSGGVDSSLVTAIAARQVGNGEKLRTFAIGFDEPALDERTQAERVARHLGTTHRTFVGHVDLLGTLPEMVRHFGEPFGDATALAMYLLSQRTREDVTVALSGDGGDEAFGGYEWYGTARRLRTIGSLFPRPFGALGLRMTPQRLRRVRHGLALLAEREGARYGALRTFLSDGERSDLYAGELARSASNGGAFPASSWIADLYEKTAGTALRRMRVVDYETYLADCLMPKVDVPSMAFGLEARAPLLDQELVTFALGLPDAWLDHPSGGKRILRAVLARYLPESLMPQRKRGFTIPLHKWLPLDTVPHSEPLLDSGWFEPAAIQRLADEHVAGARDHSQRLYNLLVLAEWLRS